MSIRLCRCELLLRFRWLRNEEYGCTYESCCFFLKRSASGEGLACLSNVLVNIYFISIRECRLPDFAKVSGTPLISTRMGSQISPCVTPHKKCVWISQIKTPWLRSGDILSVSFWSCSLPECTCSCFHTALWWWVYTVLYWYSLTLVNKFSKRSGYQLGTLDQTRLCPSNHCWRNC